MSDRLDNGHFEQDWRDALWEAQVEPPKAVWQELDHALTNAELIAIKRRLVHYKWATIAAIAFGLLLGMLALTSRYDFKLGEAPGDILVVPKGYEYPEYLIPDGNFSGYAILRSDLPTYTERAQQVVFQNQVAGTPDGITPKPLSEGVAPSAGLVASDESSDISAQRESFRHLDGQSVAFESAADPSDRWVQSVPGYHYYRPLRPGGDIEPERKRFWAGLNLGAGYYNPNYQGNAQLDFVNDIFNGDGEAGKQEDIPELTESMKGGTSYMMGVNMGINISKRWSIEGGMQYSLSGTRSLSNLILESERFNQALAVSSEVIGVNAVTSLTEDALTVIKADETEQTNTFQFVSVPLQAGYLLLDRRLSLRINGGVAANLYLGNTIAGSDQLSELEINPQNSPYRALNLGTITGLEVGYRLFDHFHISVEPVYQRSLHSLTKSTSSFATNPSSIGLETGLRYSF